MSCLATWRQGSSHYLVAMLNHTHIHNDEARYRCFLYQQERSSPDSFGQVVYKMAQSDKASCVGLWSVDEGVKTFKLTKSKLSSDTLTEYDIHMDMDLGNVIKIAFEIGRDGTTPRHVISFLTWLFTSRSCN